MPYYRNKDFKDVYLELLHIVQGAKKMEMIKKNNKVVFVLCVLAAWAAILIFDKPVISAGNLIYGIGEYKSYNSLLFENNTYLAKGVISPRWLTDAIFSLFMHSNGGNWGAINLGFVYFATFIEAIAIANIIRRVCYKNHILYTLILTLLFPIIGNYLGGMNLINTRSISIGISQAFAIFAISFIVHNDQHHKNYTAAYILAGVASLFHIHEGLYCFAIIFIFALLDVIYKKGLEIKEHWAIIIYIVLTLAGALPTLMTDMMPMSNEEFVNMYALWGGLQTHLKPSHWGIVAIMASLLKHFCVMFYRFQYLYAYEKQKINRFFLEAGALLISWCGAVLVMYIFTEKIPLAIVPTLFIVKYFKYVLLVTLIWSIQTFSALIDKKKYMAAYAILFFLYANHNWGYELLVYFVLIALLCHVEYKKACEESVSKQYGVVVGLIFLAIAETGMFYEFSTPNKIVIVITILLWMLYEVYQQDRRRISCVSVIFVAALLITMSLYGKLYWIEEGNVVRQTGENYIRTTLGDDLYYLSIDFKDKTNVSDIFVADSNNALAGWVQIKSLRSVYATIHAVPSSKASTGEWYKRCTETEGLLDKEISDIVYVMDKEDIQYILVDSAHYETIDSCSELEVFVTSPGDSYRMYRRVSENEELCNE